MAKPFGETPSRLHRDHAVSVGATIEGRGWGVGHPGVLLLHLV